MDTVGADAREDARRLGLIQQDIEQSAGVDIALHTYPHRSATRFWHVVFAAVDASVPRRFVTGPLHSLAGVGVGVSLDDEGIDLSLLANTCAEAVQLLRWAGGLDPTWPPCPIHEGRHPLSPDGFGSSSVTRWRCPITAIEPPGGWPPVGELGRALGDWGYSRQAGSVTFLGPEPFPMHCT